MNDTLSADANFGDALLANQRRRWQQGERVPVEDYLQRYPVLWKDNGTLLNLIFNEFVQREAIGDKPTGEEYQRRFPHLASAIEMQFALDRALAVQDGPRSVFTPPIVGKHILCPHCRNLIEVAAGNLRDEVACPSCGSSFRIEAQSTVSAAHGGQKLDRFTILATLGQGAFGTVYKARDPKLDRIVALKVPRAGNISGVQERDRFLREARSAAQLRHPSIVAVHEVGESENTLFLVSEYVEGVTLAELLNLRVPPPREAAELMAKVADALQYAHEQGVVHRDVKPSNIMVDKDRNLHVMDFGLAKRDAGEITMTLEGQVLGTPAYMSPEQARGEGHDVDGRSDIYSVGVILYQMLTGELPFRGTTRMLLYQVLNDDPRSPRTLNDRTPRDLETICLKCLSKEPERRYCTFGEVGDDLRRFLRGEPIVARPVGRTERFLRWCRRNPVVAGQLATIVSLALIGTATVVSFWMKAADARAKIAQERERLAQENLESLEDVLAESLLRPIGHGAEPNPYETQALDDLSENPSTRVRLRFLEKGLASPASAHRLERRCDAVARALKHRTDELPAQFVQVLQRKLSDSRADVDVRRVCVRLGAALDVLEPSFCADAIREAKEQLRETADPLIQSALADAMVRLRSGALDTTTDAACCTALNCLLRTMAEPLSSETRESLGKSAGALATRLSSEDATAVLVAELHGPLNQALDPAIRLTILETVKMAARRLEPSDAAHVFAELVSMTDSKGGRTPPTELAGLIAGRLNTDAAEATLSILLETLSRTESSRLASLATLAECAAERVSSVAATTLAYRVVDCAKENVEAERLKAFMGVLQKLAPKLQPDDAQKITQHFAVLEIGTKDPELSRRAANVVAVAAQRQALKDPLRATQQLLEAVARAKDVIASYTLLDSLRETSARLSQTEVRRLLEQVSPAILLAALDVEPSLFPNLAKAIDILSTGAGPKGAQAVWDSLAVRLTNDLCAEKTRARATALAAKLSQVRERISQDQLKDVSETLLKTLKRMTETTPIAATEVEIACAIAETLRILVSKDAERENVLVVIDALLTGVKYGDLELDSLIQLGQSIGKSPSKRATDRVAEGRALLASRMLEVLAVKGEEPGERAKLAETALVLTDGLSVKNRLRVAREALAAVRKVPRADPPRVASLCYTIDRISDRLGDQSSGIARDVVDAMIAIKADMLSGRFDKQAEPYCDILKNQCQRMSRAGVQNLIGYLQVQQGMGKPVVRAMAIVKTFDR